MIDFAKVQASVETLKQQLAARQIDDKTFEDRLLDLIDLAEDGHYWMFGHESNRWFRHDGRQWQPADPPQLLAAQTSRQAEPAEPAEPVDWGWLAASLLLLSLIIKDF